MALHLNRILRAAYPVICPLQHSLDCGLRSRRCVTVARRQRGTKNSRRSKGRQSSEQFSRLSKATTYSSTPRINFFCTSISHPYLMRMHMSAIDSLTMLQGMGISHPRIATSKTTDLPNQGEYTQARSLVPPVVNSVSLRPRGPEN
jgi:hypothetical protein